jgi:tRNA-Thr(GGU) m(6)t(6)A37 methyltransferase TsaA
MNLKAIGTVRSDFREPSAERLDLKEIVSEIEIEPVLAEALDGLEEFSHIIVLYWMHRASSQRLSLKVHPMGRKDVPVKGIFAVRTPNRPNRIGKSTVRLLQRQKNVLRVQGLDALDGSPVLDIKPYMPGYDSADDARVPSWITK